MNSSDSADNSGSSRSDSSIFERGPGDATRQNETAFKYMSVYHSGLAEKLYKELCSFSFGEYDIAGGQISPLMWTNLYEIFAEAERLSRKLPPGTKYSVNSQKYANEAAQIASVMSMYTALPFEYSETVDSSLLSKLIQDDKEFRRVFTLLLWSEKAIREQEYESGMGEKVRRLESHRSSRSASIQALKRTNFGGAPKNASLDPDAPGMEEDASFESNAMAILFQLLKSGEITKAAELAVNLGMGPIGAQLQLHSMMRNPADVPYDPNSENQAAIKRGRRAKYFQMLQKLLDVAQKDEDSSHLLLLNALRGNLNQMLNNAKTLSEKVWSYANSAFLARLLAAEGSMTADEIAELFDVPLTAKSIIEELNLHNEQTGEVVIFLRVIDSLLNDEIEELLAFAREQIEGYVPLEPTCRVNIVALDLFFQLVAIIHLTGYGRNENGDVVVAAQFNDLRHRVGSTSHKRMAAFYSRFLPPESKNREIIQTMKQISSEKEREIFAENLRHFDLNFGDYACLLIKQVREEEDSDMISVTDQIDHWHWLLIGGTETALAAVEEMNRLIRLCLLLRPMRELMIRHVIREALNHELPQLLSSCVEQGLPVISLVDDGEDMILDPDSDGAISKIGQAMNEFIGHCTFIDLYNFIVAIAVKLGAPMDFEPLRDDELRSIGGVKRSEEPVKDDWEASLRVRARAELTLREDAAKKRAIDQIARNDMIRQHIENAMPLLRGLLTNVGWRNEHFLAPRANGDPMKYHREQLMQIRNTFIPQFFILFAQAASKLDDMLTFIEFFSSFDPDNGDLGIDAQCITSIFTVLADLNLAEAEAE